MTNEYMNAHHEVYRIRGSAKDQTCVRCGDPANEWAYLHPEREGGRHSDNPEDYAAMCWSCHRRFDWQYREPDARKKHTARMQEVRDELHRTQPRFNSPTRRCSACGMVSTAMAIGTHQKASSHVGYEEIT